MEASKVRTRCCVVGGGPAGMMLGVLLARAGVATVVLEKHGDFLRDFRGDTVHPSTLDVMGDLGWLEDFLALPHQEVRQLSARVGKVELTLADFTHVPTRCKFIALMPQWDFLTFLAARGRRYGTFDLRMRTAATDSIEENGRVVGVRASGPEGPLEVRADLVVAADGRHSTMRAPGGFVSDDLGAPMDVLWMRLPRLPSDAFQALGRVERGKILVTLDRGTYWQCAYVIPKGGFDAVRAAGIDALRAQLAEIAPFLADRLGAIASWDDVSLLTVRVDRLRTWWKPGLLCIGDAAHAMSPVGGVGINMAVQDAVAAANILAAPLRAGGLTDDDLARVQRRREWPTRVIQSVQVFIGNRVIGRVLGAKGPIAAPAILDAFQRLPLLRTLPAWLVGVGVRPEHPRTPELVPPSVAEPPVLMAKSSLGGTE
ncbi:MAG: FAD-dependent oxidoreductase [Candidatus Baltobacteraceae bacterium]